MDERQTVRGINDRDLANAFTGLMVYNFSSRTGHKGAVQFLHKEAISTNNL